MTTKKNTSTSSVVIEQCRNVCNSVIELVEMNEQTEQLSITDSVSQQKPKKNKGLSQQQKSDGTGKKKKVAKYPSFPSAHSFSIGPHRWTWLG